MNVLLVVLDSVRAPNCSVYDYPRATTPTLASIADEATTYTGAVAPSNWSLPSHVSLFTGLETEQHQVTIHDRLESGHTVWDDLADRGYETGLFTENGFVASHPVDLHNPFETVVSVPDDPPASYVTGEKNDGPDGFYYADALLEWIDGREQWAACLNLMDAHRPYEPRPVYDRWGDEQARQIQAGLPVRWEFAFRSGRRPISQLRQLESLYDGGIRQADAVLDRVVTRLRERGIYDDTLLVICGDHGEGFGEGSRHPSEPRAVAHIVPMSEELLHVPLVVKHPGQVESAVVDEPAALTAFPDVVDAALDRQRDSFVRDRVVAAKQPITGDLRERYESVVDDPERLFAPSRAVYTGTSQGLIKEQSWSEVIAHIRLSGGDSEAVTRQETTEWLDDAFDGLDDSGVSRRRQSETTVETREQLQALGYF